MGKIRGKGKKIEYDVVYRGPPGDAQETETGEQGGQNVVEIKYSVVKLRGIDIFRLVSWKVEISWVATKTPVF